MLHQGNRIVTWQNHTKPIGTAAWMYLVLKWLQSLNHIPRRHLAMFRKPKSQWRAAKNNPRSQASHGINMMWPHDATVSRRTGICQSRKSPCKWCSSSVGQTGLKLISTDKPKRMIFIHIYTTLLQCQSIHTKWWPWWICPPCETKNSPLPAVPLQVGGEVEAMFDRHRQLPRLHFVRFQTWAIFWCFQKKTYIKTT